MHQEPQPLWQAASRILFFRIDSVVLIEPLTKLLTLFPKVHPLNARNYRPRAKQVAISGGIHFIVKRDICKYRVIILIGRFSPNIGRICALWRLTLRQEWDNVFRT